MVLDLDATDVPLHGRQEGRFLHGCCDSDCYMPLYIFCGRHPLAAKLRRSNIDASDRAADEVARIVGRLRERWPEVEVLARRVVAKAEETHGKANPRFLVTSPVSPPRYFGEKSGLTRISHQSSCIGAPSAV